MGFKVVIFNIIFCLYGFQSQAVIRAKTSPFGLGQTREIARLLNSQTGLYRIVNCQNSQSCDSLPICNREFTQNQIYEGAQKILADANQNSRRMVAMTTFAGCTGGILPGALITAAYGGIPGAVVGCIVAGASGGYGEYKLLESNQEAERRVVRGLGPEVILFNGPIDVAQRIVEDYFCPENFVP